MRFRFTLTLWGDWHISQLEKHGLPSLKAPGNLDAIDYHISVNTRPADRERVTAALQGLNFDIKTPLRDDIGSDQGTANDTVFTRNVEDRMAAIAAGEAWGLLSPDMVWGEGTWAHHRYVLESGKWAIFRPLLRVDASMAGTIADFSKRNLARIALECEHSVAKTYYRADGEKFSNHAEMIIWPAPGGLINRTITAEVPVCIPSRVPLHGGGLAAIPLENEMHVVADSDEAIALAMAQPDKDMSWLANDDPISVEKVRGFLRAYDSPASRFVAWRSYWLHADDVVHGEWLEPERRLNEFIRKVFE